MRRARKTHWEFVMRDIRGVLIDLDGVVHEHFVWWGEKEGVSASI